MWTPAEHRPESIAYRLENGDKTFVVTGDTEYAESVVELARDAHTLLIDCTFPDQRPVLGHLTPKGIARGASEAGGHTRHLRATRASETGGEQMELMQMVVVLLEELSMLILLLPGLTRGGPLLALFGV